MKWYGVHNPFPKLRQFRVAFIESTRITVNITEAVKSEMRVFGAPNAVVRLKAGQEHERRDQRNREQANGNNSDLQSHDVLPQHETCVVEQPNNNHHLPCTVSSSCTKRRAIESICRYPFWPYM